MAQGANTLLDTDTSKEASPMEAAEADQEELILKKKAYCLLYQFISKRDSILRNLDLPSYEVPWLRVPQTQTDHHVKKEEAAEALSRQNHSQSEDSEQEMASAVVGRARRGNGMLRRGPFKI